MAIWKSAVVCSSLLLLTACKPSASVERAASPAPQPGRAALAPPAAGAPPVKPAKSDIPPGLRAEAEVTPEQARATALGRLPGSTILGEELEREGGRLIYTFETTTPGREGIDEVNVDALDGTVVDVHHEES